MNEFTRQRLYRQAFALLDRVNDLLDRARLKHEQRLAEQVKKAA